MLYVTKLVRIAEKKWPRENASKCMKLGVKQKNWNGSYASFAQRHMLLTGNINAIKSTVLNVQRITEGLENTDVSFARINISVK